MDDYYRMRNPEGKLIKKWKTKSERMKAYRERVKERDPEAWEEKKKRDREKQKRYRDANKKLRKGEFVSRYFEFWNIEKRELKSGLGQGMDEILEADIEICDKAMRSLEQVIEFLGAKREELEGMKQFEETWTKEEGEKYGKLQELVDIGELLLGRV